MERLQKRPVTPIMHKND